MVDLIKYWVLFSTHRKNAILIKYSANVLRSSNFNCFSSPSSLNETEVHIIARIKAINFFQPLTITVPISRKRLMLSFTQFQHYTKIVICSSTPIGRHACTSEVSGPAQLEKTVPRHDFHLFHLCLVFPGGPFLLYIADTFPGALTLFLFHYMFRYSS